MLRHIIYAVFAIMLGVAIMLLPLMMLSHHFVFTKTSQTQLGEAEKSPVASDEERTAGSMVSKESFGTITIQRNEGLASIAVSSLLYALFIVATGLAAATAVLLLAKRVLL